MKVGVFGGTFDPVHVGHLYVVDQAQRRLGLDIVYVLPNRQPPHKPGRRATPFGHRLAMVRFAFRGWKGVLVSDLEGRRDGPSYTVDTLREIRGFVTRSAALYLIMGADSFREIRTWKSYVRILRAAHVAVADRPTGGVAAPSVGQGGRARPDAGGRRHTGAGLDPTGLYRYNLRKRVYTNSSGKTVTFLDAPPVPVSSTAIRESYQAHHPMRGLVPEAVHHYIEENGLYR
nr:nicotinate (nicotinamide) nucleotide adenylyltransferase [Nitrospirota bacterium]